MVHIFEDDRKNLERHIQHSIDERSVESDACDHGFCRKHYQRTRKLFRDDRLEVQLDLLVRVVICMVASVLSKLLRFFLQQHRAVDLREEDESEASNSKRKDRFHVLGPAPRVLDSQGCTSNWRQRWSANNHDGIE